jgi:hypothetical protein
MSVAILVSFLWMPVSQSTLRNSQVSQREEGALQTKICFSEEEGKAGVGECITQRSQRNAELNIIGGDFRVVGSNKFSPYLGFVWSQANIAIGAVEQDHYGGIGFPFSPQRPNRSSTSTTTSTSTIP